MILMLLLALGAFAQYYDAVINMYGTQLFQGLRTLISTNTNTNYIAAKEQMFGYFDNNGGFVRCVYTGVDWSVPYGGMPDQNLFNTEHTYAQSWFSAPLTSVKKADLHHLFPTNAQVNSSRGNLPFDIVANHSSATTYVSANGYHSYRGNNSSGILVFEPANQHKGNLARALLYFYTRYDDTLTQANVNMLPVLLDWHTLDPVDAAEIARNQSIYQYQNNRNPFVDHPEFVQRIWGPVSTEENTNTPLLNIELSNPYPNPTLNNVHIAYKLPHSTRIHTGIYNIKGQLVKSIEDTEKSSGNYEVIWNGNVDNGEAAPRGVYIIKVQTERDVVMKRVLKQ